MAKYRQLIVQDGTGWHLMSPSNPWEALRIAWMLWRYPDRVAALVGVTQAYTLDHWSPVSCPQGKHDEHAIRANSDLLAWVLAHPETYAEVLLDAAAGEGEVRALLEQRRAGLAGQQENTMTKLTDRELQTLRNLGNDDAAAEIESLRAKVHTQALQILTLTGEVAGFAADAERYRKGAHGNVKGTQGELGMAWCDFSGHAGSVARVLWVTDAEVDAAIAASKVE